MPYAIRKQDDEYCVINENDDTVVDGGCHATHEDAERHLTALQINVESTEKAIIRKLGGVIKRVSETRFEGYMPRFGNADDKDLDKEYFSPHTVFLLSDYPIKGKPVNYNHGMSDILGAFGLGMFDLAEEDEIGIRVGGEMKRMEAYIEWLRELGIRKGLKVSDAQLTEKANIAFKGVQELFANVPMAFSGGYDPATWRVADNGEIMQAGTIHGAFTPTPADPHNPKIDFFLKSIKSAHDLEHERKTFLMGTNSHDRHSEATIDATRRKGASNPIEADNNNTTSDSPSQKGLNTMQENEMGKPEKMEGESMTEKIRTIITMLRDMLGEKAEYMDEEEMKRMYSDKMADELKSFAVASVDELNSTQKSALWERTNQAFSKAVSVAVNERADQQTASLKAGLQAGLTEAQKNAPGKSQVGLYGNPQQDTRQSPRITVEEERAYASFKAEDMALAAQMYMSMKESNKAPAFGLSDRFFEVTSGKAEKSLESNPLSDAEDYQASRYAAKAIKSIKADELNAVAVTNQGAEWVSTYYYGQLWERARFSTNLVDSMTSAGMIVDTVPFGTNKVNIKLDTGSPTVYLRGEPTSLDATNRPESTVEYEPLLTDEVEATLKEHAYANYSSRILNEQSLIQFAQAINRDASITFGQAVESAIINGDTATGANTNINLIDGTPAGGNKRPLYLAWDGLRKNFLVTATANGVNAGGTLALDTFFDTRDAMNDRLYGLTDNLVFVMGVKVEKATRRLSELRYRSGDNDVNLSTIYTGSLTPLLDGIRHVTSGQLELANTSGKISATGSNNTTGTIICVYAPYTYYARQRGITIDTAFDIDGGGYKFVMSATHLFVLRNTDATTGAYNVAV